jgi:two-component system alkaline phosphatase synthesis response regulator PhoP
MSLFSSTLLVEDELQLAETLKIALRKLQIPVQHVTTLEAARRLFQAAPPEFILLDRSLPDGDGLEWCEELRRSGYAGTILMLTAAGRTEDRVIGLNAGADDYLPKPFSWPELEARIKALGRRKNIFGPAAAATDAPAAVTATGGPLWQRNPDRLKILGPLGWVELTPLEFKLATKLIQAGGAIVTRDELLKDVWGFKLLPKTRTVDHFLGRLRKHFERNPEQPDHFLTVRGAGYRFER